MVLQLIEKYYKDANDLYQKAINDPTRLVQPKADDLVAAFGKELEIRLRLLSIAAR